MSPDLHHLLPFLSQRAFDIEWEALGAIICQLFSTRRGADVGAKGGGWGAFRSVIDELKATIKLVAISEC